MNARLFKSLGLVLVLILLIPTSGYAYIGPGAGFAFVGSFLVLFAAIFMAIITLITFPVRMLWRALFKKDPYRNAKVDRVVVLGLDGLDPGLVQEFSNEGLLPNFHRLEQEGSFNKLRTTFPPISPVAWSSFATGSNPGKHNIFDFLSRDVNTYLPDLSSVKIGTMTRHFDLGFAKIPMGQKPSIEGFRRGESFWKYLGNEGIMSQIIRVPITFPPDDFKGMLLSAMCVPDLRGTQGTFTLFTTDKERVSKATGGVFVLAEDTKSRKSGKREISSAFIGPDMGGNSEAKVSGAYAGGNSESSESIDTALKIPFKLTIKDADTALLEIPTETLELKKGEYTDWVTLTFDGGFAKKVDGICLLMFTEREGHIELYCSPINIDPRKPALPISNPHYYSIYLGKLLGPYATLGLCEDTWALEEEAISDEAFIDQSYKMGDEREAQFFNAIDKTKKGLVVTVFDETDRIQHMFWRYREDGYPGLRENAPEKSKHAIRDLYIRADKLVGKTLDKLGKNDVIFVMSDHGFKPFNKGIQINNWLYANGYLTLKEGMTTCGDWYRDVDWSKTRAYGFGLNGIYINLEGRESRGIVKPGKECDDLKEELINKLSGLEDPETGKTAINQVFDPRKIYVGPYKDNGPDLLLGVNAGYRVAWDSVTGEVGGPIFKVNKKAWSGDHCLDPRVVPGVFFSNIKVKTANPRILDVAPTILDLFGVAKPAQMDGNVMEVDLGDKARKKR